MISLQKGQKISLTKESANLKNVLVGLGWDASQGGKSIDCDASVIMLKVGKFADNKDLIYFGNKKHSSKSVIHMGDNLTGAGSGDDEVVKVNLTAVPSEYDKLVFVVNIFNAKLKSQDFGMINNAYIRLINDDTKAEICRYDLSDNYDGMTSVIFGEMYSHNTEWKFSAMGQGTTDKSVKDLCQKYL